MLLLLFFFLLLLSFYATHHATHRQIHPLHVLAQETATTEGATSTSAAAAAAAAVAAFPTMLESPLQGRTIVYGGSRCGPRQSQERVAVLMGLRNVYFASFMAMKRGTMEDDDNDDDDEESSMLVELERLCVLYVEEGGLQRLKGETLNGIDATQVFEYVAKVETEARPCDWTMPLMSSMLSPMEKGGLHPFVCSSSFVSPLFCLLSFFAFHQDLSILFKIGVC